MSIETSLVRGIPLSEEPGIGALTIGGYLREVRERFAGREALVMRLGPERVTYSYDALWSRSVEVARALIAAGVGKGMRVGILMTNRPEHVVSLFGIALAGGVAVSLSTFSTPGELEYLLQASSVSLLLYERQVLKTDFGAILQELEPRILTAAAGSLESERFPYLRRLVALEAVTRTAAAACADGAAVERWDSFLASGAQVSPALVEARARSVHPADPGGLFFSSGTTSLPKGILHTQRAFAIQWWRWPRVLGVHEPARSWTGNGFFWSANVTMVLGSALSTGGAVILQPTFEPEAALELLQQERVTLMNGRPHQWVRLCALPGWAAADLSHVRHVTRGELIREHPSVTSTWERPNSYGTTETMTIMTAFTADTPAAVRGGSFGAPLPGNRLKIVDPGTGAVLPLGERGEICVKGPTLMLGYIDKAPEQTFDEEGYFHTGDGGHVDAQGRLFWAGRMNSMIKTAGANVSPEEVDAALATCPGVKRAQTVGLPHDTLGEMVVSCIVRLEGSTLQEQAIVTHLKGQLASFKIPRAILFFEEAELPLTANEKIKVEQVRQLAEQRLQTSPT